MNFSIFLKCWCCILGFLGIPLILHNVNKEFSTVFLVITSTLVYEGDNMSEIKREDLLRKLNEKADPLRIINDDAVDFVLWKLNEIKEEVGLRLKNREERTVLKDSA